MSKDSGSERRKRDKSTSKSPSRSPTPKSPESKKSASPQRESRSPSRSPSASSSASSSLSASSSGSSRSKSGSKSVSSASRSRSRSRTPASTAHSTRSQSKSPSEGKRRSPSPVTRLHINRLSRNVNKEHLTEIFQTYGKLKSVDLQMDRFHPQLGRGSAYITYEKPADAEKAIKYMDGGQIDGMEIIVTKFRKSMRPMVPRRHMAGPPHHYRNGGGWRRFSPRR